MFFVVNAVSVLPFVLVAMTFSSIERKIDGILAQRPRMACLPLTVTFAVYVRVSLPAK
jgi:hypothetical protein